MRVSRGNYGEPIGVKLSMYPEDGQMWVNLGLEECKPEAVAVLCDALREAADLALM